MKNVYMYIFSIFFSQNPSYFAFLKATEIMMQQIGKLLRSAKNKGKDHTDEVDDCLLRLQDVIRMAAFHNTAFYDGSIKESIEVTDEVRELLERLRTKLHYVRNFLELLKEDAFCKR